MPTLTQSRLFGEVETDHGTLTIPNERLYPFLRIANSLVDEAKLRFTDDGLSITAVDPANVGLVDVTLDWDHGIGTATLGAHVEDIHNRLGNIPRDTTVDLELSEPYGQIHIESDGWDIHERVGWIPKDSVREEPDLPSLDLPVSATVSTDPVASYISKRDPSDHLAFRTVDGELWLQEGSTDRPNAVARADIDADEEVKSVFGCDYIQDAFGAIRSIGADSVTVELGDEFPLIVNFETEHISGHYMVAPRIQSE